MKQGPRVSLGLPVYNGERYLEEALQSALAQTFADFELVISDNGSTDRSEEVARAYAARDSRIQYHRNVENRGAAWNFNRTFALSSGEYFKWMSHDDRYSPTFLERCVEVLDRNPDVVLAYPLAVQIDEDGMPFRSLRFELHGNSALAHQRFRFQICIPHWCFHVFGLIRADVLRRTRLIDKYVASDRVLLAHLALLGRFYEIQEELFFQREHLGRSAPAAMEAHSSLRDRSGWFDPARDGALVLPSWRLLSEYFLAVVRSPLSLRERLACELQLARWLKWNWKDLAADLGVASARLLRRNAG